MEGKDNIKELFSQKLGNYEAKVNPELWAKISTQVAAGAATTSAAGLSLLAKIAIGIGVSAAAITTVVILSTSSEEAISEQPTSTLEQPTTNSTLESTPETVQIIEDISNTALAGNQSSVNPIQSEQTQSGPTSTPSPDRTYDPISAIDVKQIGAVGASTMEPEIVEGISYLGMTNYGGSAANLPPADPVEATPKPEAIKRYVNVFTPNGDGKNDVFFLESEGLTDFSLVVFDPRGEIVFKSSDANFRWDGRDIRTGEFVESGTYMYMVSAYDSEGNPYPIYERLTINR